MDTKEWDIAERLRTIRQHRGWSQTELGKRSGVHSMIISRIERGAKKDLNGATLRKLAMALRVSSDYLLGLTDDINSEFEPAAVALVGAGGHGGSLSRALEACDVGLP